MRILKIASALYMAATVIAFVGMQFPHSAVAGIIQAIIPAAVPTANKEGNGSKFQLFTGADPATGDCAQYDANHNLTGAGAGCTTPGFAFISAALGDGVTDATATIQAALNSTASTIIIPRGATGAFLISGLTVPDSKWLQCAGMANSGATSPELLYTGSGTAVTTVGRSIVTGCRVVKQGTLGGNGILLNTTGVGGATVQFNAIENFTNCVFLDGAPAGVYFPLVHNNAITGCTNGINTQSSGGNLVNSATLSDNVIHSVNKGIVVCHDCGGILAIRNDIEFPTGDGGIQYDFEGNGNVAIANWSEYNALAGATNQKGFYAPGHFNTFIGNIIAQQDTANWTAQSIASGNLVLHPDDNSGTGSPVPDMRMPGTINFQGFIQGTSGQPAVDATGCTGATIGTGATNLAGTITGLPTGACSVVITFASATAAHGWGCGVSDLTTANLFRQSASTTTKATFAGVSVSGDVLSYSCIAY